MGLKMSAGMFYERQEGSAQGKYGKPTQAWVAHGTSAQRAQYCHTPVRLNLQNPNL